MDERDGHTAQSPTLLLPRLVAGRDYAQHMVRANLGSVIDHDVTVDASLLMNGTPSFAAQLVESIVVEGKAASLTLVGGPASFVDYVADAADQLRVADHVVTDDRRSRLAAS